MSSINYFHENIKEVFRNLGISSQTEEFLNSLEKEPSYSFKARYDTPEEEIREEFDSFVLKNGIYYLDNKPEYINSILFKSGKIYPQEPSSIVWGSIFDQIFNKYINEGVILDLCAAPGGKSLSILNTINNTESILISNEIDGNRANTLVENVDKWKSRNAICSQARGKKFGELSELVDIMCIDAPCSGEGMIRKLDNKNYFFKDYNQNLIKKCKNRQVEIIKNTTPALKNGGYLIYSTCTYNLEENENAVKIFEDKFGYKKISLDFVNVPDGVVLTENGFLRFFPHKFDGEGLFISLLQKKSHYETDKEYVSLWKKQRTDRPKLVKETKNSIIAELVKNNIDLKNNYVVKYDVITDKPVELFLVNKKNFNLVEKLNNNNFKLKYIGKKIATYGKNIQKSIKIILT